MQIVLPSGSKIMISSIAPIPCASFADRLHHLLRSVRHGVPADDGEAGIGQGLPAGPDVVTLEPDHQWEFESGLAHGGNNAGGDDIAIHDTAENIHQDSLHVRPAQNNLKASADLSLARPAADFQKVGGAAAVVLDD